MTKLSRPLPRNVGLAIGRAVEAFAAFDAQLAAQAAGQLDKPMPTGSRTVTHFLKELDASGITLTAWTLDRGFSHAVVASVVSGACKGSRGQASRVLVAMGVQPPPAKSRFALVRRADGGIA